MSLAPGDKRHGTTNGYSNLGCRCADCRRAWSLQFRQFRARRRSSLERLQVHGTEASYSNWGCRCDACRTAASETKRLRYARQRGEVYRPRLTPEERDQRRQAVAEGYEQGLPDLTIAKQLGVSRATVLADRAALGLVKRQGRPPRKQRT